MFVDPTSFDYYLQLVPTEYTKLNKDVTQTVQYSVTEFAQRSGLLNGHIVPSGIALKYDFTPILVRVQEQRRTALQFATSLCAIIGGVFALSGLINSSLFKTSQLFVPVGPTKATRAVE